MPDGILMHPPLACCDTTPGLLPLAEARARLLAGTEAVLGEEMLPPAAALGRILGATAHAALSLPPFDQSAMDGYALHQADLHPGAFPQVVRRVAAGDAAGPAISPGTAVQIFTGAALPEGTAAVAMEEHVLVREGRAAPRQPPQLGSHIRYRGEDVMAGEALLAPGTRLDARHIALLAATGVEAVRVRRRVRVALLSNGNELGTTIRDSNRPMLRALLDRPEIACTDAGVLPDDPVALARALGEAAATHDLILASGGISGSDADYLPRALAAAGEEVTTWKLALKPGKPLAHGRIGTARCLFLPGNPLAALVTMLALGRPLLARMAGLAEPYAAPPVLGVAASGFSRKPGREEFMPVRIIGHDDAGLPLLERTGPCGSARLKPLAAADGLLWLDAGTAQVEARQAVSFHPFAASFGLA